MRTLYVAFCLLTLTGCGEAWDTYEKPNGVESAWHQCMRENSPLNRHTCKDLK